MLSSIHFGSHHSTGSTAIAIEIDPEMQVVAAGKPGLAGLAEDLPLRDRIAGLDVDRLQMAIEGEEPEPVVDDDRVAVDAPGRR